MFTILRFDKENQIIMGNEIERLLQEKILHLRGTTPLTEQGTKHEVFQCMAFVYSVH